MDLRARSGMAAAAGLLLLGALSAAAQETAPPPPQPSPVAAAVTPAAAAPAPPTGSFNAGAVSLRITDAPSVRVEKLPPENPFGSAAEVAAALPPKPAFSEQVIELPLYAAVRVDRAGKSLASRWPRNPIPSLAPDLRKSFSRWTFEPARRAGQPVDTWASYRLDLHTEVRPPKIEQITLTPVTPATPIPAPLEWGSDAAWYDSLKPVAPLADGTVLVEQTDTLAVPKKTPWDADSYKGPFSIRMWVKVSAAGRADRVVLIQASDPLLIAYFRKQVPAWQFRPARINGQAADSWAELAASGTIGYSVEIKQIGNLRKTLPESAETPAPAPARR